MIIGKLDRRITIERATESVNGFGEREKTWATFLECWAALDIKKARSMQEGIQSSTEAAKQRMQWRIRYSPDAAAITEKDRLVWKGKTMDIIGVAELGRNQDILITSEIAE